MLRILKQGARAFEIVDCSPGWRLPQDTVWVDLVEPTRDEELRVEESLGLLLPTREEMEAIEPSSRLYQESGATFITAFLLINADTDQPDTAPVTFVLTNGKLVTIRYGEPRAFKIFVTKAERTPALCPNGVSTFLNLLDAVVDRTADVLERVADDVDGISRSVFAQPSQDDFQNCLYKLGRAQALNAEIRDSLSSLVRATGFAMLAPQVAEDTEHSEHLVTVNRDVQSLSQQSDALSNNIGFQLNAALGFISIQQTRTARAFSIIALLFLPPTLVASNYGMNFEHMPELHWKFGYLWALGLMVASVVISLLLYRRKRWL